MDGISGSFRKGGAMRLRFVLLTGFAVLASTPGAHAQACALCYTIASQTSLAAQRSLDIGILALLVPALTLFLSVIVMLYRRAISATA
jgi:hypothetical protein